MASRLGCPPCLKAYNRKRSLERYLAVCGLRRRATLSRLSAAVRGEIEGEIEEHFWESKCDDRICQHVHRKTNVELTYMNMH